MAQRSNFRSALTFAMAATAVLTLIAAGPSGSVQAKGTSAAKTGGQLIPAFSPYPMMVYPVRIGVTNRAAAIRVAVYQPGAVFVDGRPIFPLRPMMVYSITPGKVTELGTGVSCPLPYDRRAHVSSPDYRVWTNNRWYRGCLELISLPGGITAVNLLDMEEYLLGVVPSEMPSSWHPEALKCQAVAARSYAYAHLGPGSKWKSEGYDLVPDVRDQAYKGLAAEAMSTFGAVQATRGIILKDAGKVKPGFYRAWVGDELENLNIRKERIPQSTMERITGIKGIQGVTVKQWDANGNANSIQIMGEKASREVYGVALAHMLGLKTAGILDVHEEGPYWLFTYRGPGNGSRGLSQHGANMFAKRGWRFDQILQQYYQDADGQLRLDYLEHYKPMQVYLPPRKVKTAKAPGYAKSLIEQDKPAEKESPEADDKGKDDKGKDDKAKDEKSQKSTTD